MVLLALPLAVGCSSGEEQNPGVPVVVDADALCNAPARSGESFPVRIRTKSGAVPKEVFSTLKERVDAQCGSCHRAPETRGGFQYVSDPEGLKAAAPRMAALASQGAMPPLASADQAREAAALGCALESWAAQGSPAEEPFDVKCEQEAGSGGALLALPVAKGMTDLGHCIPDASKLGTDPEKDAYFAGLTELPRTLAETDADITTFNTLKLARHGTFAFAPTYPLFSDHAKKLRLVHVPAGKSIEYDAATKHFKIPSNTRFYKTFFKAVTDPAGNVEYKRIETRLIVTRERWQDALFGTYIWNDAGTSAELHDLRYRDGSPFSDRVLIYTAHEGREDTRNYAIPGRHRCVNCHTGAEAQKS